MNVRYCSTVADRSQHPHNVTSKSSDLRLRNFHYILRGMTGQELEKEVAAMRAEVADAICTA